MSFVVLLNRQQQRRVVYLLRDLFTTDEAAPLTSPRTCEPGPGTWTVVQNDGQFSISGGNLEVTPQSTPNWGDLGFYSQGIPRETGLAFVQELTLLIGRYEFGFGSAHTNFELGAAMFYQPLSGNFATATDDAQIDLGVPPQAAKHSIILRSQGAFFVREDTLLWVSTKYANATVHAKNTIHDGDGSTTSIRVARLRGPWLTDYGIATQRLAGARSAGDTFTHEANALIEFTVDTLPSSGEVQCLFRMQDASNFWQVVAQSTGKLELGEIVGGSYIARGSASGVVANGDRIVIIADGTTIRVYEANTLRITYSSASNFQGATSGKLDALGTGGAVSDIITWPRTLSGAALAELNRV